MANKLFNSIVLSDKTAKNTVVTSLVKTIENKEKDTQDNYIAKVEHIYENGNNAGAIYYVVGNAFKTVKGLSSNVIEITKDGFTANIGVEAIRKVINDSLSVESSEAKFQGVGTPDNQVEFGKVDIDTTYYDQLNKVSYKRSVIDEGKNTTEYETLVSNEEALAIKISEYEAESKSLTNDKAELILKKDEFTRLTSEVKVQELSLKKDKSLFEAEKLDYELDDGSISEEEQALIDAKQAEITAKEEALQTKNQELVILSEWIANKENEIARREEAQVIKASEIDATTLELKTTRENFVKTKSSWQEFTPAEDEQVDYEYIGEGGPNEQLNIKDAKNGDTFYSSKTDKVYTYDATKGRWDAVESDNIITKKINEQVGTELNALKKDFETTKAELTTSINTKAADNATVKLTGNQTIAGTKTFSSTIAGSINGNAATATKLATARTINGIAFDGSGNITVADSTAVKLTGNQTIAGTKTFSALPVCNTTPTANNHLANKKYVDDAKTDLITTINSTVKTSGNQTIAGTKTFSALPVCSVVPTNNTHLVNKKYVDDAIAAHAALDVGYGSTSTRAYIGSTIRTTWTDGVHKKAGYSDTYSSTSSNTRNNNL